MRTRPISTARRLATDTTILPARPARAPRFAASASAAFVSLLLSASPMTGGSALAAGGSPVAAADLTCLAVLQAATLAQTTPRRGDPGAQPNANPDRPAVAPPSSSGHAFTASAEMITVPSIGLSMRVPNGSRVTVEPQSTRRVVIQAPGDRWIASIDVKRTLDTNLTIEQVTQAFLDALEIKMSMAQEPARKRLTIGGSPAEEIRMRVDRLGDIDPRTGKNTLEAREVRIYTIIRSSPGTFLIHTFYCDAGFATEAVAEHERSMASVQFTASEVLAEQRDAAITATEERLTALDINKFRALLGTASDDRFYRVFRRTDEGRDQEIGYYRVQMQVGKRGAVDRAADPRGFQGVELDEGLLVRFTGRYLAMNPDGGLVPTEVIDVESDAWVAFDRRNEMWSVRQARYVLDTTTNRYRQTPPSVVTGARRDGRIVLSVSGLDTQVEPSILQRPPRSYISQAELHLLYRILQPLNPGTTFGMFVVDAGTGDMEYRTETVQPSTAEGRIFISSKRNLDSEPDIKTLDTSGAILRVVRTNGEITALSTPEEIQKTWKSKGLPTGSMADALATVPTTPTDERGGGSSRRSRQSR